ncbi:unnamed protein product [Spirodela intermedia]|uniref:Uncharacterized protein n=1 Tax=Spirodela intermedia TaxID=51605 RepID=A0A7I8K916_SPIIN|nr:unnamed protein product [Spirodela intermedia]
MYIILDIIIREDRRVVSTASKALLGQRRCGFILRSAQQEEALHRIWRTTTKKLLDFHQNQGTNARK